MHICVIPSTAKCLACIGRSSTAMHGLFFLRGKKKKEKKNALRIELFLLYNRLDSKTTLHWLFLCSYSQIHMLLISLASKGWKTFRSPLWGSKSIPNVATGFPMGPNHYQVVVGLQIHQKEPPAWWGEDRATELMWRESSISNGIRMGQWLVEDMFLLGSGKV